MKACFLSVLEEKIEEFLNETFEEWSDYYDGWYHDELGQQMALAAAQVMDATFMAQEYGKKES